MKRSELEAGYTEMMDYISWTENFEKDRMRKYDDFEESDLAKYAFDYNYHLKGCINAFIEGATGRTYPGHGSRYYGTDYTVKGRQLVIRVSDHPGRSDAAYRKAYGNTGIPGIDKMINEEPPKYILSLICNNRLTGKLKYIEVDKDQDATDPEDCVYVTEVTIGAVSCDGDLNDITEMIKVTIDNLID